MHYITNGYNDVVCESEFCCTFAGNILLNISLTKSIPTSLQGKSVSLSCVPNPPVDSKQDNTKPICMLIRVKTEDDAKELLKQLTEHKK